MNKCLQCGKPVKNKFCNKAIPPTCKFLYDWSLKKKQISSGKYPYYKNLTLFKRYLIEINGHKCSICKTKTWMGKPIPLVLDHINGRAKDCRLKNLRLVCGNCDMQLPTYKSKNKNSDRTKRKGVYL